MKKGAPIKRDKSLVTLSRDHHDGLMLVWKIRQGISLQIDNERIATYVVNAFDQELQPHFIEEEGLLFIQLAPVDDLRVRAENEHGEIREKIASFRSSTPLTSDLLNFAALLEAHIRFEERVLFPELEQVIPREQLDEIGKQLEQEHATKHCLTWLDEFWVKK